jgi:hypothetical protein
MRGKLVKFSGGKFIHEYLCPACGHVYRSSAPELSDDAVCHGCFTGRRRGRGWSRAGARGARVVKKNLGNK